MANLIEFIICGADAQSRDRVVELYSGVGLPTRPLTVATGEVGATYAVETTRETAGDARASLRGLPWARTHTAKIDAYTLEGVNDDVVVADSSRVGLGTELAAMPGKAEVGRIVPVSCDPVSMVRDVVVMRGCRRKVTLFEAVNIFPSTRYFECITVVE